MNERLKLIREEMQLTQEEFGKRIGAARNTIANYEMGKRAPSNTVILAICREFGVNELWLKTGVGEPHKKIEGEERFAYSVGKLQNTDNETLIRWVNAIAETRPELLEEIEVFFKKLLGVEKEPD